MIDINECEENNGDCSHECANKEGSYECVCPPGFKIFNYTECVGMCYNAVCFIIRQCIY